MTIWIDETPSSTTWLTEAGTTVGDASLIQWTSYTPIITAGVGTLTSYAASGRYTQISNAIFVSLSISITTNGTASNFLIATLPTTPFAFNYVMDGRENQISGKMLQGVTVPGTNTMLIFNYDNSYPGGNNASLFLTGSYEAS